MLQTYRFLVEFRGEDGILDSQVGAPIMKALGLNRIRVTRDAHQADEAVKGGEHRRGWVIECTSCGHTRKADRGRIGECPECGNARSDEFSLYRNA